MMNGRNRNIGTSKQGHGQDNELVIPQPSDTSLHYHEKLQAPKHSEIEVQGLTIKTLTEPTNKGFYYSCSTADVQTILEHIPKVDIENLELIIFRQPTKKERIVCPVWGRYIYSFEHKGEYHAAIMIEATPEWKTYALPKKLSVDGLTELQLLKKDGMDFRETKREFVAQVDSQIIRNVQLYRTLLHELGHHVHYLSFVERPSGFGEDYTLWERLHDSYFSLPSSEKESYANRYAEKMKNHLTETDVIPFSYIND